MNIYDIKIPASLPAHDILQFVHNHLLIAQELGIGTSQCAIYITPEKYSNLISEIHVESFIHTGIGVEVHSLFGAALYVKGAEVLYGSKSYPDNYDHSKEEVLDTMIPMQ